MAESEFITSNEPCRQPEYGLAEGKPEEIDDDSLIRWMLSLTPTQRLEVAQGFVDSVMAIRNGQATT